MKGLPVALLLVAVAVAQAWAAPVVINNVPNWNQPADYNVAPDSFVQPPDPPPNANLVTNWCVPSSTSNIMGWFEDTQGAGFAGLADGLLYPNRVQPYPALVQLPANPQPDGTPDSFQNQWLDGQIELGWHLDTEGWRTNVGHFGTNTLDMPGGIQSYLSTYLPGSQWTVWNYSLQILGGVPQYAPGWIDLLQGATTPTFPVLAAPPANGVQLGDPLLVSWDTWLNLNQAQSYVDNTYGITWYDWTGASGPGHCVTGVGYAGNYDPDDFSGSGGANGPLPLTDWVICHDTWPQTGNPNLVAVPFWQFPVLPAQSLWRNNTHLEFIGFLVPEPSSLVLFSLVLFTLRRWRRRV